MSRGSLIILEGCDRTGKTTQGKLLVDALLKLGKNVIFMHFPDRSTAIGKVIDEYLSCTTDLNDHTIHLLFSANRWESVHKIENSIAAGKSVVIDRYAFSGAAFTAAKKGLDLNWCCSCDKGLPKPDLVIFLDLREEVALRRGHYGGERYENVAFQKAVREVYMKLCDETWKIINADKTVEELHEELKEIVIKEIEREKSRTLEKLWL